MGDLERRLTATLERVAATTRARDRWDELPAPGRAARVRWVAVAAGFAVVVAAVAAVPALLRTTPEPFEGGDGPDLVVVDEQPPPPELPGGELPRLALALPDATLVSADQIRLPDIPGEPGPAPGHHQYFAAGDALQPPLVHVVSWTGPDQVEPPDELSEIVWVRGRDGFFTHHGQFAALEWRDPDVSYVEMRSAGMEPDEIVALANAMELRDDPAEGFDLVGLPGGAVPVFDGTNPAPGPGAMPVEMSGASYELADGQEVRIQLRLTGRPFQDHADAIFRVAWDAELMEPTTVRGVPALLAQTGPQRFVVVWREGSVVGTVEAGVPLSRLEEVLAALQEISEAEWQDQLATVPPRASDAQESVLLMEGEQGRAAGVLGEACGIARRWIEFQAADRTAAAEDEAAAMASLVANTRSDLALADPRYATVVRRMGEAVRAGDVDALRAEFDSNGLAPPACGG